MVDPQRGIRHLDRWYVHPELFTLRAGTTVDALSEPWDARCLYAMIRGQWVPCLHGPVTITHASFDKEAMFEAITLNGQGALRAALEQDRQMDIALAIEDGKRQAAKRKSDSFSNPDITPAYLSTPRLPAQHAETRRFSHFDDQES